LKRSSAVIAFVLVLLVLSVGVYAGYLYYAGTQSQSPTELRVFIAASLVNVVKENQQAFEKSNNAKILFNAGGSDALYQQIVSGSPADVYMAADFKWLEKLRAGGLLYEDKYWNFTSNILVVILPADNPSNITSLVDLTKPGLRIVIGAPTVPCGKYTNITLTKIDATWGNKASSKYKGEQWNHFRDRVIKNIISYEPSVDQITGKVLTGTADAGFVYISDAQSGGSKLRFLEIPAEVNTLAIYGIGVIKASSHHDLAQRYVDSWLSSEGQTVLHKFGFGGALSSLSLTVWISPTPKALKLR
jgi:molybdate transport system substrate-binding protein